MTNPVLSSSPCSETPPPTPKQSTSRPYPKIERIFGAFSYEVLTVSTTPKTTAENLTYEIVIHVSPTDQPNIIARLIGLLLPESALTDASSMDGSKSPVTTAGPSQVQEFIFSVFGQIGEVRTEIMEHPIRKGSGVFGRELEKGSFAFVEHIWIADRYRGMGIARQIVELVIEYGKEILDIKWVFTQPNTFTVPKSWIRDARDPRDEDDLENEEQVLQESFAEEASGCVLNIEFLKEKLRVQEVDIASRFWRNVGARRIGMTHYSCIAIDPTHPSHALSEFPRTMAPPSYWCENPNPHTEASCMSLRIIAQDAVDFPLHAIVGNLRNDAAYLTMLKEYLVMHGWITMLDAVMTVVKGWGTLLHVVSRWGMKKSLRWLVKTFGVWAREARDDAGHTAQEAMEAQMDRCSNSQDLFSHKLRVCLSVLKGGVEM